MEKKKLTLDDVKLAHKMYTTSADGAAKRELQEVFSRTYDAVERQNLTTMTEIERQIEALQSKMPGLDGKRLTEAQELIKRAEGLKAKCSMTLGALHSGELHNTRSSIKQLGTHLDVESTRDKDDEPKVGR